MPRSDWQTFRKPGAPSVYIPYTEMDTHVGDHKTQMGASRAAAAIIYNDSIVAFRTFGGTLHDKYRIASVSKLITGSVVGKLINEGLSDGTLVRSYLGLGTPSDSRANNITVRHCLDHKGGWRDDTGTNHVFNNRSIATSMGVASPPTMAQLVQYALTMETLQYNPGSAEHYANIGYIVLGRVIEQRTGQSFEQYTRSMLALAKSNFVRGKALVQDPHEVAYLNSEGTVSSVYDSNPGTVEYPYGGYGIENMTPGGGMVMTVQELALYITGIIPGGAFPAPAGDDWPTQSGFSYTFNNTGSMPGTYACVSRRWDGTNLRTCISVFNKRTATSADDEIATEMLADTALMV